MLVAFHDERVRDSVVSTLNTTRFTGGYWIW
jgi:hypothetical protein